MTAWPEELGFLFGALPMIVLIFLASSAFEWHCRPLRPVYAFVDWILVLVPFGAVVVVGRTRFADSNDPQYGMFLVGLVGMAILATTILAYLRARREETSELMATWRARADMPAAAREFFGSKEFAREFLRIGPARPPSPAVASDVIAYWAYRGVESGEYPAWSWSIFDATAVRGWRMSSPVLAEHIPALTGPYLRSSEADWDPQVDREFRAATMELLSARFSEGVPA